LFKKECEALEAYSCYKAGEIVQIKKRGFDEIVERFEGKPKIEMYQHLSKEANVYYEKGCDLESAISCSELWKSLNGLSASKATLNAIGLKEAKYREADCDLTEKHNGSCNAAALAYLLHVKTKKGFQQALNIYRRRCDNNFVKDCRQVVALYKSDKHGAKDKKKVAKYSQKLCDLGDAKYCNLEGLSE